ncbi:MAG: mechanosensitive ion channel family protein [Candidatus Saccharibacteria bacterium]
MYIIEDFLKTIIDFLPKIPMVIIGVFAGWFIIKFITIILKRALKIAKLAKDVSGLVITLCKLLLWIILLTVIASALGLGSLAVAISGSAAVAAFFLSASVGPTLSNIFSGIFLAGDPDIKVGMKIITNSGKTEGVIKGIDMRKVRILDDKGILHVVPNSVVENGEWIVIDRNKKKQSK